MRISDGFFVQFTKCCVTAHCGALFAVGCSTEMHDRDQNVGDKRYERCDVCNREDHFKSPRMVRMIGLATIDTPHSCTAAEGDATAFGGLS
jgi:hypothetical protein